MTPALNEPFILLYGKRKRELTLKKKKAEHLEEPNCDSSKFQPLTFDSYSQKLNCNSL